MYKSTRLSCVIAAMACLVPVLACQASTAADSEVCVPFEGEDAKRCKELLETDQLLNKTYEKALGAVSNQEKKQLRNEQRQWLRFQRDDLCKTRDLPSEREAWFRELVNRPREAECVIHFTKVRIIQIEAKTPGSVTKVTNYTPETLAEFLKKQEFKVSSRSAAPIAFCKRFLDSLIERVNIDYSRPLAQAMSLPDKSVDNVMKGCSPHSLTDAHYASGPVFRFYSSAGSESDKLRGIRPLVLVEIAGEQIRSIPYKFIPEDGKCGDYSYVSSWTEFLAYDPVSCQIRGDRRNLLRGGETFLDVETCTTSVREQQEWTAIVEFMGRTGFYVFRNDLLPYGEFTFVDSEQESGWNNCEFTSAKYRWRYPNQQ